MKPRRSTVLVAGAAGDADLYMTDRFVDDVHQSFTTAEIPRRVVPDHPK
ncbi:hypothetical protein [Natrinema caseinilyticum]|nr:hypothetical protein [Natrinema caseinilyticum]